VWYCTATAHTALHVNAIIAVHGGGCAALFVDAGILLHATKHYIMHCIA
jgi:hypothetical protein